MTPDSPVAGGAPLNDKVYLENGERMRLLFRLREELQLTNEYAALEKAESEAIKKAQAVGCGQRQLRAA